MALDRFNENMDIIARLGDDPKRDDGLSTPQFKSVFDKAGLLIQKFLNEKLIPQIENFLDEGTVLGKITEVLSGKLDKTGGTMEGPINMNGQSLSGLNAPTKDDEAATKGYADELIRTAASRNLLDNSDFRNPVNQRGFVSGNAVAAYGYFIDRWINCEESTIKPNLSNNGIKPNGAIYQCLDSLSAYVGKKMTVAIGISPGNVVTASGTLTNATTDDAFIFKKTDGSNEIAVGSVGGIWYVWIDYPRSTIQWAALYEGEYTAETLPPYVPKGYGAELAECLRYYQKEEWYIRTNSLTGSAEYPSTYPINFPMMRIAPTVTFKEIWKANATLVGADSVENNFMAIELYTTAAAGSYAAYNCFIIRSADL